jgi:hypothetical protein
MNKITSPVMISLLVVAIAGYIVYSRPSPKPDIEQFTNPVLPTPTGDIQSGPPGPDQQINSLERSTESTY